MDSGFGILLLLFIFVPLLNLSWFITEVVRSFGLAKQQSSAVTYLTPLAAIFFLAESITIDLYIASHARM